MASITYDQTTAFGSKVYVAVQSLQTAKANLLRAKTVADGVTAGGTVPANLETNAMFKVASGGGSNFYNAIVSINSAIQALQAITDLDEG